MKKLLFALVFILAAFAVNAQRDSWTGSIPGGITGADTTIYDQMWSGYPWSGHLWYESLDNTDGTIGIYGSNFHPDSAAYVAFWIDADLDGVNDNPKTMSDTSWLFYSDVGPFRYTIIIFTKASNTSGNVYFDFRKQ